MVEIVFMNCEDNAVLFFKNNPKLLVLNKTNARTISNIYGEDFDLWAGKSITLVSTVVEFQGQSMEGIRVKPAKASAQAPAAPKGLNKKVPTSELIDDEVPF